MLSRDSRLSRLLLLTSFLRRDREVSDADDDNDDDDDEVTEEEEDEEFDEDVVEDGSTEDAVDMEVWY